MTNNDKDFTIPSSPWLWVMNIGLLLILAGTAMPLLRANFDSDIFRYIYSAGAALAFIGRLVAPSYKGSVLRVRRATRLARFHPSRWRASGIFCTNVCSHTAQRATPS